MNNINVNVLADKHSKLQNITSLKICLINLVLFKEAQFSIDFFDNKYVLMNREYITLVGNDYENWNSDDYILQYISNKYGIQISGIFDDSYLDELYLKNSNAYNTMVQHNYENVYEKYNQQIEYIYSEITDSTITK